MNDKMKKAPLSLVMVLMLVMLACNLPILGVGNRESGQVATVVAKTMAAINSQQAKIPTQPPRLHPSPTP